MLSPEVVVIGAIVKFRDIRSAMKEGLLPSHFGEPRARRAYAYLVDYAEKNGGDVPLIDVFIKRTGYEYVEPPDNITVGALAKEIIAQSKARQVEQILPDVMELRRDPDTHLRELLLRGREILISHGDQVAVTLRDRAGPIIDRIRDGNREAGIPYPWSGLNEASLGMFGGELIVLYGRPGCMKTWTMSAIATCFIEEQRTKTALFYPLEMSADEIHTRVLTLLTRIPYGKIRSGKLNDDEQTNLDSMREQLKEPGGIGSLVVVEPSTRDYTELLRHVDIVKPDILFVDSAYLLSIDPGLDTRDTRSLSRVCRELTQIGKTNKIPVVISVQARRAKSEASGPGGGDDIGYSDVLAQDADVLLRLYPVIDENDAGQLLIYVSKSRKFSLGGVVVTPPPTGECVERTVLGNTAAAQIELLKADNRGKKARKASSLDTNGFITSRAGRGGGNGDGRGNGGNGSDDRLRNDQNRPDQELPVTGGLDDPD